MNKGLLFVALSAMPLLTQAQTQSDTAFDLLRALPPRLDLMAVPSAYTYHRLGIFCKLDVRLEKRFRIPVFFRLGDARQVEALDGKGPLARPIGAPEDR